MSTKTRVLHVRVVGFSAPERQMLNSIFLLSVAPARQIGYKLWNAESGAAPDMYLLDGDSESAVASWQATFASTSDRTLVVGSKNTDLGVASAARPLGLKVVGAMDRLAIALNNQAMHNAARESAVHDVSQPAAGGTMPTSPGVAERSMPAPKHDATLSRGAASMNASMNATMNATMSATVNAAQSSAAGVSAHAVTMTAAAPAATVLPNVTLQPNVAPPLDKTLTEKPVTDKTVDRILSDKPVDKLLDGSGNSLPPSSGATPLSPSALAAAVAPSPRPSLRVVPLGATGTVQTLAASLPSSTSASTARVAELPLAPPATVPVAPPAAAPAPVAVAPPAPVATPAPAPAVTPVAPAIPVAAPTPRHEEQVFRVLAVDDSPLMRTFLQNKLQPYGIVPEFAASGEEALFKISKQHFDLIFLDVMLPGMDGYDVCKMIKKNKDNSLMKVVMLTSKDKTFDKIRGTMAGCDGYLTKPVDELKLRAIIERHTVTRK